MIKQIELTKKEQVELYLKCSKKELAEMLYNCNQIINNQLGEY